MMLVQGTPITYPITQINESPILINTIKGYLAYCQDQMPEQDMRYFITRDESSQVPLQDKFNSLAQIWKQLTQSERQYWDNNAAKMNLIPENLDKEVLEPIQDLLLTKPKMF